MKRKILYIASADICNKSGGAYANLAFYKSLLCHYGQSVDIIPFSNKKPIDVSEDFYVKPKSILQKLLDFPRGIIHRYTPWIYTFLEKYGKDYSCCIINDGLKGDIIPIIRKYVPKIIVIHHNCEIDFQNDNNRPTTLFGLFPYWVKRNESLSYHLADLNLFLTEYDLYRFRRLYGDIDEKKKAVIGMYLSEDNVQNLNKIIPTNKFAICGSLSNVQTVKGIKDFAKYLPCLERCVGGEFSITIAGRNPGNYIKRLSSYHSFINLIENPEDMSKILLESGIFICPINVGSGLKLRIMDGLKLGMPIITHEVSSRGYESFFNEPWFKIYNDEKSFKVALVELLDFCNNNQDVRMTIIEKFKSICSFENGDKRFIKLINGCVYGAI